MFNHLISEECFEVQEGCLYNIWNDSMSSHFQILLELFLVLEGEQGSTKETVFKMFFPFHFFLCCSGLEDELVEAAFPSSMESKEVSPLSSACVG